MQTEGNRTHSSLRPFSSSRLVGLLSRAARTNTVLKCEREEAEEAESAVTALRRGFESGQEVLASLDANVQTLRARVANLRKGSGFFPPSIHNAHPSERKPFLHRAGAGAQYVGHARQTPVRRVARL